MNAAPRRARRAGIGAAVAAALVLAGCATGQHAPTANVVPVVDGVSADAGPIALRAATVAAPISGSYAAGDSADLQLVIVNQGRINDKLVGVTTPQARQVQFFANVAAAAPVPTPVASETITPSEPTGSGSSTESASPGETTSSNETTASSESASSSPPAATTIDSIVLPVGQAISIGYARNLPVIRLNTLTSALFPAQSFQITFQFQNAGSVTFAIAVHLAPGPSVTASEDIAPTAE